MAPQQQAGIFVAFFVAEMLAGRVARSRQPARDGALSLAGLLAQSALAAPVIGAVAGWLLLTLLQASSGAWSHWPFWLAFPLFLLLVRVITTPDTHHAHHGMGRNANSRGNYAVTFFLWDTLFGTGRIPMAEQSAIGLPHSGRLHWAEELFWLLVRRPVAPAAESRRR